MRALAARLEQRATGQGVLFAIIVSAVIVAAGGVHAQQESEVGVGGRGAPMVIQPDGNFEEQLEFPYTVRFEGTEGRTLEQVEQASEALRLIDRPPTSFSRLRRRAEDDLPRVLNVMRARAHYAAKVDLDIDRSTSPITVTFKIDAGQSYDIKTVIIELDPPSEDDIKLPDGDDIGLVKDKRASSTKIIQAESSLLNRAKRQGFAHAEIGKRRVVVDHSDQTVDITLRLSPGRKVFFGETEIKGNREVETRFIRRLITWKTGKLVTPEFIDETELNLIESGLFNSVRVEPGPMLDDQGRQPMLITVSEAKHRSIEAGFGYRTDEGIGGSVGWEHRNLLGTGEQLGFELEASGIGWKLSGNAREPDFLKRRQALVIGAEIEVENTDAFDSQSIGASVGIERSVGDGMDLAIGPAFTASKVEQDGDEEEFGLLSLPASFSWDHSNDLLDPSKGGRLFLQNEPFVDVFGNDVAFNKSSIAYRRYFRFRNKLPRLVLATRAKAGFIFGAVRDSIPADERFYAGGGGSVRGYRYQTAGELDDDNDPIGGRSLLEFAGEFRAKITDTIGAAIFVDSGVAYRSTVPDFDEPLRIGAGVGVRYFSPIGPIRFDLGFPINSRDSDDAFQFYVSIGQAF
ncbi:MAG: autotransporter assembly complex protein TamA [Geminicoccaceae bacterium]